MARDVFISYSFADKKYAQRLCGLLDKAGINYWIAPRDVRIGRSGWGREIWEGIARSDWFVLLLSHNSDSQQIEHEVTVADQEQRRIIPFRLEDIHPPTRLRLFLANRQWIDAYGEKFESGANELIRVIRESETFPAPPTEEIRIDRTLVSDPQEGPEIDKRRRALIASLGLFVVLAAFLYYWVPRVIGRQKFERVLDSGIAAIKGGENARAVTAFNEALQIDPRSTKALQGRAQAYHALREDNLALADLERSTQIDRPASPEMHLLKAQVLRALHKEWEAIDEYDAFISSHSGNQGVVDNAMRERQALAEQLQQRRMLDGWFREFDQGTNAWGAKFLPKRMKELGALQQRTFASCEQRTDMNEYYYDSVFDKAPRVVEYVILRKDGSGNWRVDGYGYKRK